MKLFPRAAFLVFLWITAFTAEAGTNYSFWQIKGPASNTVSFLGSIHFLKQEFYPLSNPVESAFSNSTVVVFEADIAQMESPQNMLKMMTMAQYGEGEDLESSLSRETYAALQKRLGENIGMATLLDSFKPWFIAVTLVVLELQKMGFNPADGVDRYYFQKAQEAGKTVEALETLDFQMGLFNGLNKPEQEAFLKATLLEIDSAKKEFNQMISAWKTGNAQMLEQKLLASMRTQPQIYKKFLSNRNLDWVPKVESYIKSGKNVFIVVGVAHLVGKDSVQESLRKKGYKIQQL